MFKVTPLKLHPIISIFPFNEITAGYKLDKLQSNKTPNLLTLRFTYDHQKLYSYFKLFFY